MPDESALDLDVLIADDEPQIRELLCEFLSTRGLRPTLASDGRAAVAALEQSGERFGLVLTDINMPGADGFEVLRAARAANPSAYVVIVTGYASLDSAIQAVRLGAHDYITKPFSLGQIDIILNKVGDRLAREREHRDLMSRGAGNGPSSLDGRLEAIERRLARIEALLTADRRA
jgi:two-component system response regulator AtoC